MHRLLVVLVALFLVFFTPLALRAETPPAEGAPVKTAKGNPWSFDATFYTWLPSTSGNITAGAYKTSVNESITDVWKDTRTLPLAAMGRFEARYLRFGGYIDANYFNLNLKNQMIKGFDTHVRTQMGLLEYALTYQITGAETRDFSRWTRRVGPPSLTVYAGGRTIWMKNEIEPGGLPGFSVSKTLTSPMGGGRFVIDINPRWFFMIDGNVGGFGVQDVDLALQGIGVFGYRTTFYQAPLTLILGYKALYTDISSGAGRDRIAVDTTMHGPALGAVVSW